MAIQPLGLKTPLCDSCMHLISSFFRSCTSQNSWRKGPPAETLSEASAAQNAAFHWKEMQNMARLLNRGGLKDFFPFEGHAFAELQDKKIKAGLQAVQLFGWFIDSSIMYRRPCNNPPLHILLPPISSRRQSLSALCSSSFAQATPKQKSIKSKLPSSSDS